MVGKWQKNFSVRNKICVFDEDRVFCRKAYARDSSVYNLQVWGRIWEAEALLSLISPLQWYFVMLLPSSFLHMWRSFHSLKLTSIPAMIFLFDGMNLVTFNEGSAFIPWNWPATVFLFHGMNLLTFNEGSAYLLFIMLFQVYLRQSAIVKSLLMHIPIVCRLREKWARVFTTIALEFCNAAINRTDHGKCVILLGVCR